MTYQILSSGSHGNATVVNSTILIDCGVSYKSLSKYTHDLQLVLLTHWHGDHFNKTTIRLLAQNRPTLRFGCGEWMVYLLIECGVDKRNIDIYTFDKMYDYGTFRIGNFELFHDVPNCGYKIHCDKKIIYATDTYKIETTAKNYDLYLIEANYAQDEMDERIALKHGLNQFCYEERAKFNHLSLEKSNDFIFSNIGINGEYVYMHVSRNYEGELNDKSTNV